MRTLLFNSLLLISVTLSAQSQPMSISLFFEKADYNLSPAQQLQLEEFKELTIDSGYNAIFLKGYADIDGSDKSNLELSQYRVTAVQQYLSNSKYLIESKFYGEKEAINKNKTEEQKSLNRRVDVIFWTNYALAQKKKKPQIYTFAPNRTIEFTAAEGTKIKIPANSLVYEEGGQVPLGDIQIEITEFYSLMDIIDNKLATISNGQLLISDGMINIEASRNGKDLRLQGGATMEVGFAEREENDGFGLYYANANNNGDIANWVPAVDPSAIDKEWVIHGSKLFISDTIEKWRSKFDYNNFGQRIKVTDHWEETKGKWMDTLMIDKTINKNKIILQATKLGWINCDQIYMKENAPTINLIVETGPVVGSEIVMIFNDKKAMIAPTKNAMGKLQFDNVPKGENVTIAGVGSGEGKLYFTKKEFVTADENITLNFEETTIKNIQDQLAGYN